MNKLFLVILAICLVCTHAFVKRDAPAPASGTSSFSTDDIKNFASKAAEDLKKAFDADNIQKNFNEVLSTINNTFNNVFNNKEKTPAN